MHQYDIKTKVLNKKRKLNIQDTNLKKTDIIHIVNYCWEISFARVNTNKKEKFERGWNPLNNFLLDNPELKSTQTPMNNLPPKYVIMDKDNTTFVSVTTS